MDMDIDEATVETVQEDQIINDDPVAPPMQTSEPGWIPYIITGVTKTSTSFDPIRPTQCLSVLTLHTTTVGAG